MIAHIPRKAPPAGVLLPLILVLLTAGRALAHDKHPAPPPGQGSPAARVTKVQSQPGDNLWNAGRAPENWWEEIKRQHGHVGPWNILGWRMGQAIMREFHTEWGRHDLEILCYVPLQTPFTCLVDGLSVGTGNSLGRLDLRLVEVLIYQQAFVAARRKDHKGEVLELRPSAAYLKSIMDQPLDKLEGLSRQCIDKPEQELFTIRWMAR
jgi:formylmethanofuran dehydrogenase subunit E